MKTAIVTGASTGIGRATAIKMAEAVEHAYSCNKLEEHNGQGLIQSLA